MLRTERGSLLRPACKPLFVERLDLAFKEIYHSKGHNWAPPMDLNDRLAEAFPRGVKTFQLATELLPTFLQKALRCWTI